MPDFNPYAAPQAPVIPAMSGFASTGAFDPQILHQLAGTKGWAKFLGVLCFIAGVLIVVSGFFLMSVVTRLSSGYGADASKSALMASLIVIVPLAGVFCYQGTRFFSFAGAIDRLLARPDAQLLEEAFRKQHSVWLIYGIALILSTIASVFGVIA